ncbi:MAG TPA: pyridoxal-dependent decarboxylase [Candidatus Acidoferrum sp.]|nr:pyridoxal-dependent decarboxylase [Candidatus Acidoferrum sp.]
MISKAAMAEESLDPQSWEEFRKLAHRMLDDTVGYLASRREQPVWQPMPEHVRASFREGLPIEGVGAEAAYDEFVEKIRPYPNGNNHPRFWGWVQGTGTPLAMMADMLAAAMNTHMAGFNQAPALVEQQVLAWLAELMGMPRESSGVLVSGGTIANLIGLAVARHAKAGFDVREQGLQSYRGPRLVFYASAETHGWCRKAAELLGLGNSAFRRVPTGDDFRMDVAALGTLVESDRREGLKPFCVVGNAGTINTGAIDDLRAIAKVGREEDLWFHVDGAFGALARLSPELRPLVDGIGEADSLAFDLHKWMYLPFEVGCVLVRDAQAHRNTFALSQAYFGEFTRGVIAGGLPFAERGIELTRSFRALKVWMSLKAHGVNQFARLMEQNVAQARYLAKLIESNATLELLADVPLNVVCFRYRPRNCAEDSLNGINKELLMRLQESGIAVISSTMLDGKFALRAAIVNHRTRREDFEILMDTVARIGGHVAADA